MAIFFPPVPPVFTGGAQPYGDTPLPPSLINQPTDNPPFGYGGPVALAAEVVAIAQPNPWQYAFFGAWQPFQPGRLNPSITNQPVQNPPFSYGGPYVEIIEAAALAQPDPWQYKFMGGRQPFAPVTIAPSVGANPVNDPPFSYGGPYIEIIEAAALAQPDPWQYKFMGGGQPFQPKWNTAAIPGQSIDPPPLRYPGRLPTTAQVIAQQQPDPWVYLYAGAQQPYDFKRANPSQTAVTVNNPPFGMRQAQTVNLITAMNQPEMWQYKFMGRFQPYEGSKLNPNILGASTGFYRGYIIF